MLNYQEEPITTRTFIPHVDSHKSKLQSHLDRLYVSSGSYGSSTLRQLDDGRCIFAHGHVCVLWEFQPLDRCFQLSTPVYELSQEEANENFEKLTQLLSQCRRGLKLGHLSWSHDNKLTIQIDLPLSRLEKEHYKTFEKSMSDFMESYWKVRSNLAQFVGDSTQLPPIKNEIPLERTQRKRSGRRFRAIRRILPTRLRKK